jgi:hypothetical protein
MKKTILVLSILIFTVNSSWAIQTAIIGGLRSGMALGMKVEAPWLENTSARFEVEGSTGEDMSFGGDNPLVIFGGIKYKLAGLIPELAVSLGAGIVGYSGNNSSLGPSLSLIFDNAFGMDSLFVEAGVDFMSSPKLQLQFGYRVLTQRMEYLQ